MAIVRGVRKLLKEDFKDAPEWFDKMLSPFNQFLDSVIGALRNKLTFRENFYGEVKEFNFVHGQELEISHELEELNGVLILKTPNDMPATTYGISEYHSRIIDNKTVGVTIEFAGGGSTEGTVKLIILG